LEIKFLAGDNFFYEPSKWRRGVGLTFNYDFTEKFNTLMTYRYDLKLQDTLMAMEATYHYLNMTLRLGLELLSAPNDESYWSSYRTNDTVYSTLAFNF
jgi:hypothetical protein